MYISKILHFSDEVTNSFDIMHEKTRKYEKNKPLILTQSRKDGKKKEEFQVSNKGVKLPLLLMHSKNASQSK